MTGVSAIRHMEAWLGNTVLYYDVTDLCLPWYLDRAGPWLTVLLPGRRGQ